MRAVADGGVDLAVGHGLADAEDHRLMKLKMNLNVNGESTGGSDAMQAL